MIKVVYLYNLKEGVDTKEFEEYYFNERIAQVMRVPDLLKFTFSKVASEKEPSTYRYMAECFFKDLDTAKTVLESKTFKDVHGYISGKLVDLQVLFLETHEWKPSEYWERTPKWIKLADVKPSIPPCHKDTYSWEIAAKETMCIENISISISEILPGGLAEMDKHTDSDQFFYVLSGRGKAIVDGKQFLMEPNGCLFIPRDTDHSMEVIGKETLRSIVIFCPPLKE